MTNNHPNGIIDKMAQDIFYKRSLAALVMAAHDSNGIGKTLPPTYFSSRGLGAESDILEYKKFITKDKKGIYSVTSTGKEVLSRIMDFYKILSAEHP